MEDSCETIWVLKISTPGSTKSQASLIFVIIDQFKQILPKASEEFQQGIYIFQGMHAFHLFSAKG